MDLTKLKCSPCKGGTPALDQDEINRHGSELQPDWIIIDDRRIEKEFAFKNFKFTMNFVNKVANLADEENHHPDMQVSYSKVVIE